MAEFYEHTTLKRSIFVLVVLFALILLFLDILAYKVENISLPYYIKFIHIIVVLLIVGAGFLSWSSYRKMINMFDYSEHKGEELNKQLYKQLAESEEQTALVLHEIQNPLGGVSNCLTLISAHIKKPEPSPEDIRITLKYLAMAEQELIRTREMAKNFLDFSKQNQFKPAPASINDIVADALQSIDTQAIVRKVKIIFEPGNGLPEILADALLLRQALLNILLNALEAMPDGGEIKINTSRNPTQKEIAIRITDTGSGIAAENVPHLFEPYFSAGLTGKGTGLGLFIVKEIIDSHHGTIQVKSELNKGTTFTIFLPMK